MLFFITAFTSLLKTIKTKTPFVAVYYSIITAFGLTVTAACMLLLNLFFNFFIVFASAIVWMLLAYFSKIYKTISINTPETINLTI